MAWIFYSVITADGEIQRRNGLFATLDGLDEDLSRRGELIDSFFELPDFMYQLRKLARGRLSEREIAEFCSMLSMYVSGGVDLQSALIDMENSAKSPAYKDVVSQLRQALISQSHL